MAENQLPEEFLFDFSKSLESISASNKEVGTGLKSISSEIKNLGNKIDTLDNGTGTESTLKSLDDLTEEIFSLRNSISEQNRVNEQNSEGLFSILNPLGGVNPVGFTENLPRFEDGGIMTNTGAAIVGERGPELVLLPKNSEISPLSTEFFDRFSNYLTSIDPAKVMEDIFGSDKIILSKTEESIKVLPDLNSSPNKNFEPFDLLDKIESQIVTEENIIKDPASSSTTVTESEEVLALLDYMKSELIPSLEFKAVESPSIPMEAIESPAQQTRIEEINQPLSVQQLLDSGISQENLSVQQSIETASQFIPNELRQPNVTPEIQALRQNVPLQLTQQNEQATSTNQIAENGRIQSQVNEQLRTITQEITNNNIQGQSKSLQFPETISVRIDKDEQSKDQFDQIKDILSAMASILQNISQNTADQHFRGDSFPIRPKSRNF